MEENMRNLLEGTNQDTLKEKKGGKKKRGGKKTIFVKTMKAINNCVNCGKEHIYIYI